MAYNDDVKSTMKSFENKLKELTSNTLDLLSEKPINEEERELLVEKIKSLQQEANQWGETVKKKEG
ncbi:hypothetical protein AB1L07_02200 [Niallia alba]|uniref:hypothetical protein n=1 Tax=Niallia alba TaxID=2729105 RepID=UPI00399FEE0E